MSTFRRLLKTARGRRPGAAVQRPSESEWVLVEERDPPKQASPSSNEKPPDVEVPRQFQHTALPSAAHFRLLKLSAGVASGAGGIVCSLHPFEIDSEQLPMYRAVSYTWGAGVAKHAISIGEQPFLVRENLRDLLRCVRLPNSDCWLWVDALCIDQNSDEERNHQVRLMGKIYQRAIKVIAWLQSTGERDIDYTDIAYALSFMESATSPTRERVSLAAHCEYLDPTAVDPTRPNSGLFTWEDQWKCFADFCRLQYWTRKWIIQEVILAPTVTLQVGRKQLPMVAVEEFFGLLHSNPYRNAYNVCTIMLPSERSRDEEREIARYYRWESQFGNMDFSSTQVALLARHRLGRRTGANYPQSLHELLPRYERHECKVPSDHVYALFNLIGDHRQHLRVDYSQFPDDQCQDILRFMQQHDGLSGEDVVATTTLLVRKLRLQHVPDVQNALRRTSGPAVACMTATIFERGEVELSEESVKIVSVRDKIPALHPMQTWSLARVDYHLEVKSNNKYSHALKGETVSPHDLACFRIKDTPVFGLAATRIQDGDRIWQFLNTNVAFVVRSPADGQFTIVGRALLWPYQSQQVDVDSLGLDTGAFVKTARSEQVPVGSKRAALQYDIHLSCADLIELAFWADSVGPRKNPFMVDI